METPPRSHPVQALMKAQDDLVWSPVILIPSSEWIMVDGKPKPKPPMLHRPPIPRFTPLPMLHRPPIPRFIPVPFDENRPPIPNFEQVPFTSPLDLSHAPLVTNHGLQAQSIFTQSVTSSLSARNCNAHPVALPQPIPVPGSFYHLNEYSFTQSHASSQFSPTWNMDTPTPRCFPIEAQSGSLPQLKMTDVSIPKQKVVPPPVPLFGQSKPKALLSTSSPVSENMAEPNELFVQPFRQPMIDIVAILKLYADDQDRYRVLLNYPHNAIFKFENYLGLDDEKRLVKDIRKSAIENGTNLVVHHSYNRPAYVYLYDHFWTSIIDAN